VSGCTTQASCGNIVIEYPEVCDGTNLAGDDCTTVPGGFTGGTLACLGDCSGFDTSACMGGGDVCGDGAATGSETCDGADLVSNDCTTIGMGYTGGTLACNGTCDGWDTAACTGGGAQCGDGTQDAGEKCDDANTANGDGCNPTCDMTGTVTTTAGTAGVTGMADGTGAAAEFNSPSGIATDGTSLFVSDTANCTVRQIDLSTWAVTTLAGNAGTCGHADAVGVAAEFNIAQDLAYDSGYVYVADTDNHCIRQIEVATGNVTTVAGTAATAGTTDGVGTAALFTEPRGITTDGVNLYVADFGNHTIRQIVIVSWDVSTVAGQAGVLGSADGPGANARFNYPRSITHHGGYLYVADTNNHTVRQLDLIAGTVVTVAGTAGNAGSADGVGAAASFTSPRGIAVDAESLYVADHGNSTIRQILLSTWDVTTLCGAAGSAGSADGVGSAATMDGPWGLVFDPGLSQPGQRLYVVESSNHIVRTIE
jgi:cysteine-rich repeat protein